MATAKKTNEFEQYDPDNTAEVQDQPTRLEDMDGHELLRPPNAVRAAAKGRLVAILQGLDEDLTETEFLLLACDLLDGISQFVAHDSAQFDAWSSEDGNFNPALSLAMAYAGRLGESISGAASSTNIQK